MLTKPFQPGDWVIEIDPELFPERPIFQVEEVVWMTRFWYIKFVVDRHDYRMLAYRFRLANSHEILTYGKC